MDTKHFGYTLVEMMVVIAIMAFIAVITFYGLKSQDRSQAVGNAQKDFINNLRATQNKINTGADGLAVRSVVLTSGSSSYTVSGQTITLTPGVTYSISGGGTKSICFANPNLGAYTATAKCSACVSGTGYLCSGTSVWNPVTPPFTVTFTNGSVDKSVKIDGSGMTISRIYE